MQGSSAGNPPHRTARHGPTDQHTDATGPLLTAQRQRSLIAHRSVLKSHSFTVHRSPFTVQRSLRSSVSQRSQSPSKQRLSVRRPPGADCTLGPSGPSAAGWRSASPLAQCRRPPTRPAVLGRPAPSSTEAQTILGMLGTTLSKVTGDGTTTAGRPGARYNGALSRRRAPQVRSRSRSQPQIQIQLRLATGE